MIVIKAYELTQEFVENFNEILNMEFTKEEGIKVILIFSELQKIVNKKVSDEIEILKKYVDGDQLQIDENGNPTNINNVDDYNKEMHEYLQTEFTINSDRINYGNLMSEGIKPSQIIRNKILFNI